MISSILLPKSMSSNYLIIDFETRSQAELKGKNSVGTHNYCFHPTTDPLMLAYGFGDLGVQDMEVKLWRLWAGDLIPADLEQALRSDIDVMAWHSTFERYLLWRLGYQVPIHRFQDPQASSRYFSLTGDLAEDGHILNLPQRYAKDKRGEELIKMFSIPTTEKANKKKGTPERKYFKDWSSHPTEWEEFCEYCRQDVVAEREIARRLNIVETFPLPSRERQIWVFDQVVNDRGMPVDRDFVTKAYALAERAKKEALESQNQLTGLENSNSNPQMQEWVKSQGYPYGPDGKATLRKEHVTAVLKYNRDKLTPLCARVLEARKAAASTTYKKLAAIMRQISPDNRLRGQFLYMGSSRAGRWSGTGTQLQNFSRPDSRFENTSLLDKARSFIYAENYEGLIKEFGSSWNDYGAVLLTVKNCIRTVFQSKDDA
jgi:DNA polymerase bacteriophage-type